MAPTVAPTPDSLAGRGPAVFCGRIGAESCDATVALVRAGHPAQVAAARAVVMDDSCPPRAMCRRFWAFAAVVVLIPRSGGLADATWFSVHGQAGPEEVTQSDVPMPEVGPTVALRVADAPVANVEGWAAICVDVDLDTCADVAGVALNNLARSQASGMGAITERRSCPAAPDWADASRCWQVRTPVNAGETTVCAVIAKRPTLGGYGQIAGDSPGLADIGIRERGCPADFMP